MHVYYTYTYACLLYVCIHTNVQSHIILCAHVYIHVCICTVCMHTHHHTITHNTMYAQEDKTEWHLDPGESISIGFIFNPLEPKVYTWSMQVFVKIHVQLHTYIQ
jgi:hypothetical protein